MCMYVYIYIYTYSKYQLAPENMPSKKERIVF